MRELLNKTAIIDVGASIVFVIISFLLLSFGSSGCADSTPEQSKTERFKQLYGAEAPEKRRMLVAACDSLLAELKDSSQAFDSVRTEALYQKGVALRYLAERARAFQVFQQLEMVIPASLKCTKIGIIRHLQVGYLYLTIDKLDSAKQNFLRASYDAKACGLQGRGFLGSTYVQLANLYAAFGLLDSALQFADLGRNIVQEVYGEYSPSTANAFNTLGLVFEAKGDVDNAEDAYRRACRIYNKFPVEPGAPPAFGSLGWLLCSKGEYVEALDAFSNALRILKQTAAPTDYVYFRVTSGMALTLLEIGEKDEATKILDSSIALLQSREELSNDMSAVAEALSALAKAYVNFADFEKAQECISQGLRIQNKLRLTRDSNTGDLLQLQARIALQSNTAEQASRLIDSALSIYASANIGNDVRLLPALQLRAEIATALSDIRTERLTYQNIESITKSADTASFVVADALESVALYKSRKGLTQGAVGLLSRVVDAKWSAIQPALTGLTEQKAMKFFSSLKRSVDLLISIAVNNEDGIQTFASEITKAILISKSIMTESLLRARSRDAKLEKLSREHGADSLRALSTRLANVANAKIASARSDKSKQELTTVAEAYDKARMEISRKSAELDSKLAFRYPRLETIKQEIGATRSVLLEYFKYQKTSENGVGGEYRYIAYTIDDSHEAPLVFDIGPAESVNHLISDYHHHMNSIATSGQAPSPAMFAKYEVIATELFEKLLEKPLVTVAKPLLLLISPDAELNLLPFGTLMDADSRFLVERAPIHYISSARVILSDLQPLSDKPLALICANPDLTYLRSAMKRSEPAECVDWEAMAAQGLPFSKQGAGRIRQILKEQVGSVLEFDSLEATEQKFKQYASNSQLIHLSTHGYFLEPDCLTDLFPDMNHRLHNGILSLSGILLSRVASESSELGEDGILTAEEIGSLDLSSVRLVSLSACESGIGVAAPGETVYGLRRSFLVAGAKCIISALWRVDGNSSEDFFEKLYSTKLTNLPRDVRRIKLAQIESLKSGGLAPHPFWWGAFISFGDWR